MLPIANMNKRTQKLTASTHRPLSANNFRTHIEPFSISDVGEIDLETSHQQGETVVTYWRLPTLDSPL